MSPVSGTSDSRENKPATPTRRNSIAVVGGGILFSGVAGVLLLYLLQIGPFAPYSFHGTVIELPEPAADFTLTDHNGGQVSLSDFRGQVVILYFGYTYCPDICPTTLAELAKVNQELGRDAGETEMIMISVDPLRDTPDRLASYLAHFDPAFIGLTGTEDEIKAAASPLGIFYQKQDGSVKSGYLVDHTGAQLLIDEEGYFRLLFAIGTPADEIAADLRHILRE